MKEPTAFRITPKIKKRLDKFAKETKRTRSYIVESAIEAYLDVNEWQIKAIRKALKDAASPSAQWIDHQVVKARWERRRADKMA
ncbi:MAG: ribbon-helix-helix protein, CopG family [Nitrospinae bacterium]|nr:ribbon-helix-helix protein, CopG family [Nitrospinota bacterium]